MKTIALLICFLCLLTILPLTGVTAELLRTGQRTCFDQHGSSIDHTDTGQDGDFQNGAIWPEPRFIDNGDGTITDLLTGLMWMRDGKCLGEMSWQAAMGRSGVLNSPNKSLDGGCNLKTEYSDWFLPDILHLESLFNGEEPNLHNWLNSWGFRDIRAGSYWSRTISPNPYTAWIFNVDTGTAVPNSKVESASVLLVRHVISPEPENQSVSDPSTQDGTRFIDNGDGTITDTITSLMWLQDGGCVGTADWLDSFTKLKTFNTGSVSYNCGSGHKRYSDWSVPNRHELRSLIEHDIDLPALPVGHPFINIQPNYWTSTTVPSNPSLAYTVFWGTGELMTDTKMKLRYIWPVRPAEQRPSRERITDQIQAPVFEKAHSMFRPAGERIIISWPAVRFADQGDGTLIDNKSGLMWLKDAECFGKQKWEKTFQVIEWLNKSPFKVKCREYTESYDNWQLPDIKTLAGLTDGADTTPANWLIEQGAMDVPARDYWSVTENPLNIYHAWALNFSQGTSRNYAKSFPLFVWPVRVVPTKGWGNPKPFLKVNNQSDTLVILQGDSVSFSTAISEIDTIQEAKFILWYETPKGSKWWLADNGTWHPEEQVLYHGNVFPLDEYEVFAGRTTGMETGLYTIHFDISLLLGTEGFLPLFPTTFSSTVSLFIDKGLIDQIKSLWVPDQEYVSRKPLGFYPQLPGK